MTTLRDAHAQRPRTAAAVLAMAMLATACGGVADSGADAPDRAASSRACDLLADEEVERLMGERTHPGTADESANGTSEARCIWGDANPADPGKLVTLTVAASSQVGTEIARADDRKYDLDGLGDGAYGLQRARGGVVVVFTAAGERITLEYDVLPPDAAPDTAIDRLVDLAHLVRPRVLEQG